MHETIKNLLNEQPVLIDGAWATELQQHGLQIGASPEIFNLENPDRVQAVAQSYVDAGSRIVTTNTFGGTTYSLERHGLADRVEEINRIGVECSKRAAGNRALVFASMGPSGKRLMQGEVTEIELFNAFSIQAQALAAAGADGLVLETMYDLEEAKVALKAAKETGLPVCACMVYDARSGMTRTLTGTTVEQATKALTEAGADLIGANCGQGIEGFVNLAAKMKAHTHLPLWIKANAGLPKMINGHARYQTTAKDFAHYAPALLKAGTHFIGGCCGTNPDFIRALKAAL